jgi:hypothetical protein
MSADGTEDYASREETFNQLHLNTDVAAGLGAESEGERERIFRRNERKRREELRPLGFEKVEARAGWHERRRKTAGAGCRSRIVRARE